MSIAWVQTIVPFSGTTPGASGSFTPTSGDVILVYGADFTVAGESISFSGTGTYSVLIYPGQFADVEADPSAIGFNLSASGGSQTFTVTSSGTGDTVVGFGVEYSGVATVSGNQNSQTKPGTGAGAVLGVSTIVPTNSVLVSYAQDLDAGGTVVATAGSTRSSGTNWCLTDYAGNGASILPAFTGSNGVNDHYLVLQWLINPTIANTSTSIWLWT